MINHFGKHASEPVWQTQQRIFSTEVPEDIAWWLFDPASLTRRLKAACVNGFRVEVISQGWERPMLNEELRLGMRSGRHALVRQVHLYCKNTPWVFARTVIPKTTLTGKQRHLANLGSRPLGAVLFADPNMHRDEVEVACIRKGQKIHDYATARMRKQPPHIWGRRSVFYLDNKPLLVSEIFLPDILKFKHA